MAHPLAARLSFFTGKGGVGKSTLVAAVAVEAARQGRRPLIVELGHRASMQAIFGVPSVGHAPLEVAPGVHASNVDLDAALAEYVAAHVPVRPLAQRIAGSRSLKRFFEAAPAVGEVLTLQRLEHLLAATPAFDPVLVDFDSTGHARMFLELPRVFEGLVPDGPVRRLLDDFARLLSGDEALLHLVALPARLPVQETIELHARLRAEHAIRVGTVFVNRMPPPAAPPTAPAVLAELRARIGDGHPARVDLACLADAIEAREDALAQAARLEALGERCLILPRIDGPLDRAALAALGRAAAGAP